MEFNTVSLIVWLHVFVGVIWIGLLYYFNFVQVPAVAEAAADEGGRGRRPSTAMSRRARSRGSATRRC